MSPQITPLPQTIRPAPAQAYDPQSAQIAQMLSSLGQQPILSKGALGTNLLADALLQYGELQKQKQAQHPTVPTDENEFLSQNGWS